MKGLGTPKALKARVSITLSILDGKDNTRRITGTGITATADIRHPGYWSKQRGPGEFVPEGRGGDNRVVVRAEAAAAAAGLKLAWKYRHVQRRGQVPLLWWSPLSRC